MATFVSLAELQPLLPAEAEVVASLRSGDFDRLGDGSRPETADPSTDRPRRFPALPAARGGGGVPAAREGRPGQRRLDLGHPRPRRLPHSRDIGLNDCHFEATPVLRSAIIDSLFLDGSSLPGLQAERLEARGGLYLRERRHQGRGPHRRLAPRRKSRMRRRHHRLARRSRAECRGLEARSVLARGAHIRGGVNLAGARLGAAFDGAGMVDRAQQETALNADALEARRQPVAARAQASPARFG